MQNTLKTTLALLLAGVIHSLAQTHELASAALQDKSYKFAAPEAIALKDQIMAKDKVSVEETDFALQVINSADAPAKDKIAARNAAWVALAAKGGDEFLPRLWRQKQFRLDSPTAEEIKNNILAKDKVTETEALFVRRVMYRALIAMTKTQGNTEEQKAAIKSIRFSTLSALAEKGSINCVASLKVINRDYANWTPTFIKEHSEDACRLALMADAPADYRQLVFDTLLETQSFGPNWQSFFKRHRGSLPPAQQVKVTGKAKANMLSIASRNNAADAFLASLSADLIALKLDQ